MTRARLLGAFAVVAAATIWATLGLLATVEPVVAGALGVVLLAEDLTVPKVVGAGFVISGAVLAQIRVRK